MESILGLDRCSGLNPIRTFLHNGIMVSFGSDAPCTTPDPIEWIDKAVNNPNPNESVSIQDALRMCTYNGYYASFDEKERGSLEVGKIADMVILSDNPYETPKSKLSDLKIDKLILAGKDYQSANRSIFDTIVNGLLNGNKSY